MERIGIAGTGRLAQALGRLLYDRGQPIAAIAGRDPARTAAAAAFINKDVLAVPVAELPLHCGRVLISVPDDALEPAAHILADAAQPIKMALHTCGSRGPEALSELKSRGTSCATLHPLQTVATPEQGVADLPGSSFGICGVGLRPVIDSHELLALDWALDIVRLLDGRALRIAPEDRPLYHAAAVMASNYIVTMIDAAVELLGLAGVPPESALPALGPLIRASVENSLRVGPPAALTGPIERGDARTVAAHLQALDGALDTPLKSVRQLYRQAGLHAIEVARRKSPGVDRGEIERLLRTNP